MGTQTSLAISLYWLLLCIQNVQGCTVLFTPHGNKREETSYWSGTGYSQTACEASCASDVSCYAYAYDSGALRCKKSARTESEEAEYCSTCSFSTKQCGTDCPITYNDLGTNKVAEEPYSIIVVSLTDCRASCSSDPKCLAFGYDSSINRCSLSEETVSEYYSCSTCTFSRKECVGNFDVSTTIAIVTTPGEVSTTPDVAISTAVSTSNIGTTIATSTEQSTVTSMETSSEEGSTTHDVAISTAVSPTRFGMTIATSTEQSTVTSMETSSEEGSTTHDVAISTAVSPTKYGTTIATSTEQSMVTRLLTGESTTVLGFSVIETTTVPQSIPSVSVYSTMNNYVNDTSKLCPCHCVFGNSTSLEMLIEERKNTLKMSKLQLSSFQRRLNCAYDPRYSSKMVGSLGLLIFVLIISVTIIPDILTTANRVKRKRNWLNVYRGSKGKCSTC